MNTGVVCINVILEAIALISIICFTLPNKILNLYSGKKKFTEGWVEFKKKRIAKAVVQSLNGNIIGGKKGSYYHDDIWAMKYLPRFKWSNLTEKLAYDSAVRKKKLQQEMTQVKKETNFFLEQVDKNKQISAIKRKREEKQSTSHKDTPVTAGEDKTDSMNSSKAPKQRKLAQSSLRTKPIPSDILSSVFTQ